jgi:hypothetical protein
MNPTVKAKWIAALRSGEYKQARQRLRLPETNAMCCLGVLCDIHRKTVKKAGYIWRDDQYLCKNDVLPQEVVKWAGLPDSNPDVDCNGRSVELAVLNDGDSQTKMHTFKQIATIIQKQL